MLNPGDPSKKQVTENDNIIIDKVLHVLRLLRTNCDFHRSNSIDESSIPSKESHT